MRVGGMVLVTIAATASRSRDSHSSRDVFFVYTSASPLAINNKAIASIRDRKTKERYAEGQRSTAGAYMRMSVTTLQLLRCWSMHDEHLLRLCMTGLLCTMHLKVQRRSSHEERQ